MLACVFSLLLAAPAAADPYANDLGPDTLDVSAYPKDIQDGYRLLTVHCAKCHTAARPLNSQFIEPQGDTVPIKEAAIIVLKRDQPWLFADQKTWQIEVDIWKRYVKRMMSKQRWSGTRAEGGLIYRFLVYDSKHRKLKDPKSWTLLRRGLLDEFQRKYPVRYKDLYGDDGDLKKSSVKTALP